MYEKLIKEIAKKYEITQAKIADDLGISRQFMNKIAHNKSPMPKDKQIRLQEKFNVNPTYLLTGQGALFLNESNPTQQTLIDADMQLVTELYRKFRDNKDTEAGKLLIEKLQLMVKLIDKQITIKILDNQNLKQ